MSEIVPIPAATVTLVRDADAGLEVLMVQRSLKSGFVPGAHVFPGGALDDEDNLPAIHALCAGITDDQASRALGIAHGGLAYWAAGIRESFEEAGLLIAYDARGRIVALDEPDVADRFRQHRHALNAGARSLLDILREQKLTLAADQLVYFSHWITPVSGLRRYDTRFFVAVAPPKQAPLHDNHETISHVWVRPAAALDRHQKNDFKIRFPTMRTLEELAAYASVDALMKAMRTKRNIPAILPRISKDGRRLLPGDAGYEQAVGVGATGKWR